jgi:hypothetical protein
MNFIQENNVKGAKKVQNQGAGELILSPTNVP